MISLTIHLATHHSIPGYIAKLLTPNITIYEQRQINKLKLKNSVLSYLTSDQHKYFSIHVQKSGIISLTISDQLTQLQYQSNIKSKLKTFIFSQ